MYPEYPAQRGEMRGRFSPGEREERFGYRPEESYGQRSRQRGPYYSEEPTYGGYEGQKRYGSQNYYKQPYGQEKEYERPSQPSHREERPYGQFQQQRETIPGTRASRGERFEPNRYRADRAESRPARRGNDQDYNISSRNQWEQRRRDNRVDHGQGAYGQSPSRNRNTGGRGGVDEEKIRLPGGHKKRQYQQPEAGQ